MIHHCLLPVLSNYSMAYPFQIPDHHAATHHLLVYPVLLRHMPQPLLFVCVKSKHLWTLHGGAAETWLLAQMTPLSQNGSDNSIVTGSDYQVVAPISRPGGKRPVPQFGQVPYVLFSLISRPCAPCNLRLRFPRETSSSLQFGHRGRSPASFQLSSSRSNALVSIKATSNRLVNSRAFSSISRNVALGWDLFHVSISPRISPLKSLKISSFFI